MSKSNRKPVGRVQFVLKDDTDTKVSVGALWPVTNKSGERIVWNKARLFNLSLGDRETSTDEVLDMIESGDYFMSVIVDDE